MRDIQLNILTPAALRHGAGIGGVRVGTTLTAAHGLRTTVTSWRIILCFILFETIAQYCVRAFLQRAQVRRTAL